jgi:HlyD family secretion protein
MTPEIFAVGQRLAIYSPDLVTAEQDYLVANDLLAQSGGGTKPDGWHALLNASAARLRQLQIPDREIARLNKDGENPPRAGGRCAGVRYH